MRMLRLPEVLDRTGLSRSTLYLRIDQGLMPPPVSCGGRAIAFPDAEIDAIIRARIAGQSDDAIRALVRELIAARSMQAAA